MAANSLPQKGLYSDLYKPLMPGGIVPGTAHADVQRIIALEMKNKNKGLGQYLGEAVKTTVPGLAVALIAGLVAWYVMSKKGSSPSEVVDNENEYDTANEDADHDEEEIGVGRYSY